MSNPEIKSTNKYSSRYILESLSNKATELLDKTLVDLGILENLDISELEPTAMLKYLSYIHDVVVLWGLEPMSENKIHKLYSFYDSASNTVHERLFDNFDTEDLKVFLSTYIEYLDEIIRNEKRIKNISYFEKGFHTSINNSVSGDDDGKFICIYNGTDGYDIYPIEGQAAIEEFYSLQESDKVTTIEYSQINETQLLEDYLQQEKVQQGLENLKRKLVFYKFNLNPIANINTIMQ